MKSNRLTTMIIIGMVLGIIVGYAWREVSGSPESIKAFAGNVSILSDIFLRLIKMIIAPLVLTTLVVGIAKMEDAGTVGRVGAKTMGWFMTASILSLLLGLVMVNLLQPGHGLALPLPDASTVSGVAKDALSLKEFIKHVIPKNVFEALATNEILQIVIFSVLFGTALAALGEAGKPLVNVIDICAHAMLNLTGYIMALAPIAVFAAIASIVAKEGLGVLMVYGSFMTGFYFSMLVLWGILILLGSIFLGKRVLTLVSAMREPTLLAFSTASSESAYPKLLKQLELFGCSNKISSFVLPLGYSFNLDGSMLYCTFGTMFIAQAYGIELTVMQQITMLFILMVTSKGIAGVPRASLVVIAATLPQFNIPESGLLLLLGIDHFLDMGRSATNVIGNSIATAVVSHWEGDFKATQLVETEA